MTEHLTDVELVDLAAAAPGSGRDAAHVADCPECAERLARTRDVVARLDALPAAAHAPAGLWERVKARTAAAGDRERPATRWGLRAAAALAFFLAGAAVQSARSGAEPLPAGPAAAGPDAAVAAGGTHEGGGEATAAGAVDADGAVGIQRAGTEWVAAIAELAARAPAMPEEELAAAREVAYAAMFGAAHELRDLGSGASEALYREARDAWLGGAARGAP